MKPSKETDEVCYPFICETSALCDFEVVTDELCGHIGAALSLLPEGMSDIAVDLERLQPLAFHVNGSIRGRLAVTEEDIAWLKARLGHYRAEAADRIDGFILPRGEMPVPFLNLARSAAKKAIRLMVRIEEEGRAVPPELPRICNVMCNFLFTVILVLNKRRGFDETPFLSKSYGRAPRTA